MFPTIIYVIPNAFYGPNRSDQGKFSLQLWYSPLIAGATSTGSKGLTKSMNFALVILFCTDILSNSWCDISHVNTETNIVITRAQFQRAAVVGVFCLQIYGISRISVTNCRCDMIKWLVTLFW